MMTNSLDIRIFQMLFTEDRFASMFKTVDRLHDIVTEGKLAQVTNLSKEEVIGWLKDIAYTLDETIRELEGDDHERDSEFLRLLSLVK
ncbi:MAG: hypothetical protein IAE83_09695 [Anaerolinea sp.]|nr:hypothetical protein [Anaerolinea sp.]MCC6974983.1 hypothetical protein [Anaerolineae bacterium]CAG0960980.1 hypothetical protein ANRL4_00667 [Anaerolineae bacterium]